MLFVRNIIYCTWVMQKSSLLTIFSLR